MSEHPAEGREQQQSMLSMLIESVEGKIVVAKQLLGIVAAGQGITEYGDWKEFSPRSRRVTLLHTAKSASVELGKAKLELVKQMPQMDSDEAARLDAILQEFEQEIEPVAHALFVESEKYEN